MASKKNSTTTAATATPEGVGVREAQAREVLEQKRAEQARAREHLADLRDALPSALAERDRLDAVIGTTGESEDSFTLLGDANTRVTSLERRIARAERSAAEADEVVESARVTVEYRRGQDLVEFLDGFDRGAVDAEFLSQIQPLFDAYQDRLQIRDDAEDEARAIALRLANTPGAQVSVGEGFVQVGGVQVRTPAYMRRENAGSVFTGVVDRRGEERRREIAAEQEAMAAERRAERERERALDLERLAFFGGGSADPSSRVDGHAPGRPHVHPQARNVSGLGSVGSSF